MATRKYSIRDGFVVTLELKKADGSVYTRTYEGGEEIALDDDVAALHAHKLELADPKERQAALEAEQAARAAQLAAGSPVELVQQLIAALRQAQTAASQPAPAA